MSIIEHGIEGLRKAAEYVNPGDLSETYLKVKNPTGQPIDISGSFVFSGLSLAIKTSTINVTDTATALPATALASRNSLVIRNLSTTDILYIGGATVTAGQTVGSFTDGYEVDPGQEFSVDIANGLALYGIAESGKTIKVKITEFA